MANMRRWCGAIVPKQVSICFEPHPRSFQILQKTAQSDDLIALPLACGARSGNAKLFDFADRDGSKEATIYSDVFEQLHFGKPSLAHDVKVTTVDEFSDAHGIERIDLLKVDVEGAELDVLIGAQKLISELRINAIQFEFGQAYAVRRTRMRDFCDLLAGYRLFRLLPRGLLPLGPYRPVAHETFHFQNVVALLDPPLH